MEWKIVLKLICIWDGDFLVLAFWHLLSRVHATSQCPLFKETKEMVLIFVMCVIFAISVHGMVSGASSEHLEKY